MNFLAHAALSGNNEKILVGNFIADFVKGKAALQQFDNEIQNGILLHRVIDAFTDTHPTVALSKDRLRVKYRHYSGVIIDVFYDHFLARNWMNFHSVPLEVFADSVYSIVDNHIDVVPEAVKNFFPYMKRGNWLLNYARIDGIARALTGMSRRTPYESKMDESINELIQFYDEFEKEFQLFFPLLQKRAEQFLKFESQI
jgi:acyl carrier protein phosphodiesterase